MGFEEFLESSDSAKHDLQLAICAMDNVSLLKLATFNKEEAMILQNYIDTCSEKCTQSLSKFARENIGKLMTHSIGNYTLQKLIKRDINFRKFMTKYCKSRFQQLSANEYASRVMQCLIENDSIFCSFALFCFRKNLDIYTQGFSSVFLVSVALKCASSEAERDIFGPRLIKNFKKVMAKKYFKRVLVSYISSCDSSSLPWVFNFITRVLQTSIEFLKDRYSTLMMLAFVERHFKPMEEMIIHNLTFETAGILQSEMLGYFLAQLDSRDGVDRFRSLFSATLRGLPDQVMQRISAEICMYYTYSKAVRSVGRQLTTLKNC